MAKVRVYELAKEFGVESKVVMAKLQELGEFVRSASSTIEAPVVRKLTDALQQGNGGGKPAPARKAAPARPHGHRPSRPLRHDGRGPRPHASRPG
ncbi:translation initiation factor IF-2 N-terminal domain-containing protein, partial [Streptomyces sp. NPDC058469]|uniref:translation initiation factor IF-2 N-terminal domain-containing protein n=1 Tax=Streptomyces sp. NPDC058469 TaxID=3346514 RepID=UPI0036604E54